MTNVDPFSSPKWPPIKEAFEIQKKICEITTNDVVGKTLPSVDEWKYFLTTYAKYTSFSVRRDDVVRDDEDIITMRRWVCSSEGFRRQKYIDMPERQRRPKPITRTGCGVAFRILRSRDKTCYTAKEFVIQHNHPTATTLEMNYLRSNREVPDSMVAQVRTINKLGIKTSNIMAHVALQAGGYENVPYQLKDVYNVVAK
ncbi:protein FAR1-RELATED SEQUENCE 5-like [Cannabis sativa]|uniref:protein FAR1-RELATED SEQUENCE 5-like n=1 Tax=Cannabis sativa TaxID=3483 RepID=UPI0029CA20D3|nr:protein FAR1-RELATED SEQUENCE 5-like [Cannabis sativa]